MDGLEEAGFDTRADPDGSGRPDSFITSARFEDEEGEKYFADLHSLHLHINEAIYEFRSVRYIIEMQTRCRTLPGLQLGDWKECRDLAEEQLGIPRQSHLRSGALPDAQRGVG